MAGLVTLVLRDSVPQPERSVGVDVDGRPALVDARRPTVAAALAAARVAPRDGALLSAGTHSVLDPRAHPAAVLLDGHPTTMANPVRKGARVVVVNGTDTIEALDVRREATRPPGLPDLERVLWHPGTPGLDEVTVGRRSGEVVSRRPLAPPGTPAVIPDRVVTLSFDDGPNPDWTPKVLDILREEGVKAVFCTVGYATDHHPQLLRAEFDQGHTMCDHTLNHDVRLDRKDRGEVTDVINGQADKIRNITGQEPAFYRAPGGTLSPDIVSVAHQRGLRILGWAVDSGDFNKPPAERLKSSILARVVPGAIILMHDGGGDRSQTVGMLRGLIQALKAQGYGFAVPEPTPAPPPLS